MLLTLKPVEIRGFFVKSLVAVDVADVADKSKGGRRWTLKHI